MGGKPLSALAVAGFPSCDYGPPVLKEILRGAVDTLRRAGAVLIGGHSFEDSEIKFGLSVTGVVDRDKILRVGGASEGDVLVLTKPLGIGILSTALKGGKLSDADIGPAVDWMLMLNEAASVLAVGAGATACTDVTGFGLLGHALNMVRGADLDFVINNKSVPVMEKVWEMIDAGMVPEGAYHNLRFLDGKIGFPAGFSEEQKLVLSDPQTSGGLLIAVRKDGLSAFEGSSIFFAVIGRVVRGSGKVEVL
jgi:selenide, water dikinase